MEKNMGKKPWFLQNLIVFPLFPVILPCFSKMFIHVPWSSHVFHRFSYMSHDFPMNFPLKTTEIHHDSPGCRSCTWPAFASSAPGRWSSNEGHAATCHGVMGSWGHGQVTMPCVRCGAVARYSDPALQDPVNPDPRCGKANCQFTSRGWLQCNAEKWWWSGDGFSPWDLPWKKQAKVLISRIMEFLYHTVFCILF